MIYTTLEEMLKMASRVIDGEVTVRDLGLLESAAIVMLGINGWELTLSNHDAYELVIAVAEGHMREVDDVAKALMAGSRRFG